MGTHCMVCKSYRLPPITFIFASHSQKDIQQKTDKVDNIGEKLVSGYTLARPKLLNFGVKIHSSKTQTCECGCQDALQQDPSV